MNKGMGNHLLPFFWQHGEEEAKLREYVGVIQDAGCGAFCVESRPHPDFCGEKWWKDMDAILDEATKRNMKVWILDDSHFPTGYANGALEKADASLCRQSVFAKTFVYKGGQKKIRFKEDLKYPPKYPMGIVQLAMTKMAGKQREYDDEQVYSITAFGPKGEVLDLTGNIAWEKPEGEWKVVACGLSRNCGPHRNYINMMNADSCKILIDTVYEPHYEHYKEYFGNTIAGFFSDEPELGNGIIYAKHNVLGTNQDLPWSKELEGSLNEKYGEQMKNMLPYLWEGIDEHNSDVQEFRRTYMDMVSKLVSKDFSMQIGDWCRAHDVEYIGHLIEDDDTHTCTGSGLGHFFRGIAGQDMAGIDDIGGQVLPQGEDEPVKAMIGTRNGGFYHYTLAKLGVSAAYLDEKKKGRCMCEIFGNYGWKLGVTDMKYLADHFMVRGVNYFVPHAFTPKDYPDRDCPPHFYANGHNPQYRHFGQLCRYMNRICRLITGGKIIHDVAILYTAEMEWADECDTLDKVARLLYDAQIDYSFISLDDMDKMSNFRYVIIPKSKYYPKEIECITNKLMAEEYSDSELIDYLRSHGIADAVLAPANNRLRVLHYQKDEDMYMFVNEGVETYEGKVELPVQASFCYGYDAWEDSCYSVEVDVVDGKSVVALSVESRKSVILFFTETEMPGAKVIETRERSSETVALSNFTRSICKSVDYPNFTGAQIVSLPDEVDKKLPNFSGFIKYETTVSVPETKEATLTITGLTEGVEVFVNGVSAGVQIVPDYVFEIGHLLKAGANTITIECATTLERENSKQGFLQKLFFHSKIDARTGIYGKVDVHIWKK